jgi:hypothetical protein
MHVHYLPLAPFDELGQPGQHADPGDQEHQKKPHAQFSEVMMIVINAPAMTIQIAASVQ